MMCTADGAGCALAAPGGGFASVADALRVARAAGRYLNSPAAAGLEGPARGEALEAARRDHLPARGGRQRAAAAVRRRRRPRRRRLRQQPPRGWPKNHLGRKDAKAAVRQMRLLARHPPSTPPPPPGAITISWAREIAGWTGRIDHEELQQRSRPDPRRGRDRGGGPGRPEAPRPGRLRGVAGAGARPGGGPGRARVRRPVPHPRHHPRRRRAHPRGPDPRVRGGGHRRPGGAGQEPRPGGLPQRRAALPRRPPGGLRAAHPRQDGARPGRRRHPRRRHHPPAGTSAAWTARRSSRTPGSAPGPASTATCRARTPRQSLRRPDRPGRDRQPRLGPHRRDDHARDRRLQHAPAQAPKRPGPGDPAAAPRRGRPLQYALARRAIRFVSGPGALASALRRSLLGSAPQHQEAPSSTSATPTPSPTPSARPSSPATKAAPGPAAAPAARPTATSTTSSTRKHGGKTSTNDCVMLCQVSP